MFDKLIFSEQKPWKILLIIFLFIFLFRLPTIFIEFYNSDELVRSVCANEILSGGKPYIDFVDQQPPLIYFFFAFVFWIFGENNLYAVHFITIIIIILTSLYLYKSAFLLLKDHSSAYFVALIYGIYITAFDESFLATNGEVIYNFPVCIACYFFIKYYFENVKNIFFLMLIGFCITLAFLLKQQGGLFLGAITFHLLLYHIIKRKSLSFKKGFFLSVQIGGWFLLFFIFSLLILYLGGFLKETIEWAWLFGFTYAKVGQAPIIEIIKRYLERQGLLWTVQIVPWFFFISFVWHLIFSKNKEMIPREQEKAFFLILFFVFSFFSVFISGIRLYFQYFIQYLPPLALIAGFQFFRWKKIFVSHKKYRLTFNSFLLVTIIIFSLWHYHDLYKKYLMKNPPNPRNVNYLMESTKTKKVTKWIREHSLKKDKIFVWGVLVDIYYFSNRRAGTRFIDISYIFPNLFSYKNKDTLIHSTEKLNLLIQDMKKKKPRYIIDNHSINSYPKVYNYLKDNYSYKITISKMNIWEKK